MSKPTDTELVFDGIAALTQALKIWPKLEDEEVLGVKMNWRAGFLEGARYQFDKMKTEIESLRAENAELKKYNSECISLLLHESRMQNVEGKLTAAAKQMEIMGQALDTIAEITFDNGQHAMNKISYEAYAQYEQFKKES